MPVYMYRCPKCHAVFSRAQTIAAYSESQSPSCPDCHTPLARSYDPPTIASPFREHFNTSTGTYVSNRSQYTSQLSRLSDEASARTGIPHKYVPIDPRETAPLGVTSDGLESTLRQQYDSSSRVGRSLPSRDQPTRWL